MSTTLEARGSEGDGAGGTSRRRSYHLHAWSFTAPGVVWVFAFTIFPLAHTLYLSLQSTGLGGNRFVGLRNFVRLWRDYRFWSALRLTLTFLAGRGGGALPGGGGGPPPGDRGGGGGGGVSAPPPPSAVAPPPRAGLPRPPH